MSFKDQKSVCCGWLAWIRRSYNKNISKWISRYTFFSLLGKNDSNRLIKNIKPYNQNIKSIKLNILESSHPNFEKTLLSWAPTHLYFFATPYIQNNEEEFDIILYKKFVDFYITGFLDIVKILIPAGLKKVFYPSSIFVKNAPVNLKEYSLAKELCENMCNMIQVSSGLKVYQPRLPKLATDQTSNLFSESVNDPFPVLYKELIRMNKN